MNQQSQQSNPALYAALHNPQQQQQFPNVGQPSPQQLQQMYAAQQHQQSKFQNQSNQLAAFNPQLLQQQSNQQQQFQGIGAVNPAALINGRMSFQQQQLLQQQQQQQQQQQRGINPGAINMPSSMTVTPTQLLSQAHGGGGGMGVGMNTMSLGPIGAINPAALSAPSGTLLSLSHSILAF